MSLVGSQINPIDVNFHLQKVWKFLITIQLTKSDPIRTEVGKCPLSCKLELSLWFFEQNSLLWPSVGYLAAQWRITIRRRWLDDGRVCVVTRRSNFPKINLCRATHLTLLTRRRRRLAAASEIRRRRQLFGEWRNWATAASCGQRRQCAHHTMVHNNQKMLHGSKVIFFIF